MASWYCGHAMGSRNRIPSFARKPGQVGTLGCWTSVHTDFAVAVRRVPAPLAAFLPPRCCTSPDGPDSPRPPPIPDVRRPWAICPWTAILAGSLPRAWASLSRLLWCHALIRMTYRWLLCPLGVGLSGRGLPGSFQASPPGEAVRKGPGRQASRPGLTRGSKPRGGEDPVRAATAVAKPQAMVWPPGGQWLTEEETHRPGLVFQDRMRVSLWFAGRKLHSGNSRTVRKEASEGPVKFLPMEPWEDDP